MYIPPSTLSIMHVLLLIAGAITQMQNIFAVSLVIGLVQIIIRAYQSLKAGTYALDYLAFVSIVGALLMGEYVAGAVIAFMYSTGALLEAIAVGKADASLQELYNTIPTHVEVLDADGHTHDVPVRSVVVGSLVHVKPHEMISLDGTLMCERAVCDTSSLTGESDPRVYSYGDLVQSGYVNTGETITIRTTQTVHNSALGALVHLAEQASKEKPYAIRLAEKINIYFTLGTICLAALVYIVTEDLTRVLTIFVLATPCPLLIAGPVAFLGGVNRAAKGHAIVKRGAVCEAITDAHVIVCDKTGTLTSGVPHVDSHTRIPSKSHYDDTLLFSLLCTLESISLHPYAGPISAYARTHGGAADVMLTDLVEEVGLGVRARYNGKEVTFMHDQDGVLMLRVHGESVMSVQVRDELKHDALINIRKLSRMGYRVIVATGDSEVHTRDTLGTMCEWHAGMSPQDKYRLVKKLRSHDGVVMLGDGVNDAPALAAASASVVYAHAHVGEQAHVADAALFNPSLGTFVKLVQISRHTVRTAKIAMYGGVSLSIVAMCVASFGMISPVVGAVVQEGIDVCVIVYALYMSVRGGDTYEA